MGPVRSWLGMREAFFHFLIFRDSNTVMTWDFFGWGPDGVLVIFRRSGGSWVGCGWGEPETRPDFVFRHPY